MATHVTCRLSFCLPVFTYKTRHKLPMHISIHDKTRHTTRRHSLDDRHGPLILQRTVPQVQLLQLGLLPAAHRVCECEKGGGRCVCGCVCMYCLF